MSFFYWWYIFGLGINDGGNINMYMMDLYDDGAGYDLYRGTGPIAHANLARAYTSNDGWNYFKLEIYPPGHWQGTTFKQVTWNGQVIPFANPPYTVADASDPQIYVILGGQGTVAPAHAYYDEITLWSYREEYIAE